MAKLGCGIFSMAMALFDRFQMLDRDEVVRSPHGFLGLNKSVDIQNVDLPNWQYDLCAMLGDFIEITHAKNAAETIDNPEIALDIEILLFGTLRRRESQWQVWPHSMNRMQIFQGSLDSHQIGLSESTANIDIPRRE